MRRLDRAILYRSLEMSWRNAKYRMNYHVRYLIIFKIRDNIGNITIWNTNADGIFF